MIQITIITLICCLLFFCLFSGDKPEEKTNCHDRCSHRHFLSVVAYSSKLA